MSQDEIDIASSLEDVLAHVAEKHKGFHPVVGLSEIAATGRLMTLDPQTQLPEWTQFSPKERFEALKQLNAKMTPGFKARDFTDEDLTEAEDLLDLDDKALVQSFIDVLKKQHEPAGERDDPIQKADEEIAARKKRETERAGVNPP